MAEIERLPVLRVPMPKEAIEYLKTRAKTDDVHQSAADMTRAALMEKYPELRQWLADVDWGGNRR